MPLKVVKTISADETYYTLPDLESKRDAESKSN